MLKKVLLKISGEYISVGSYKTDFNIEKLLSSIKEILDNKILVCIVIGGGNICRGRSEYNDKTKNWRVDKIGMLSTLINANILEGFFEQAGIPSVVLSSISMPQFFETYTYHVAEQYLGEGRVVIFGGGTAMSGVSTDTLSITRALEMGVSNVVKISNIDGIYNKDPNKYKDAEFIKNISYKEMIERRLGVMDFSAAVIASENKVKTIITNKYDRLYKVLTGGEVASSLTYS